MANTKTGTEVFGGSTVDVWWAPTDTAAPSLPPDASTARSQSLGITLGSTAWKKIGAGFIDEDGFNVDLQNTINKVFVLRSTAPQRVYRTQEEPMITFNLFEGTARAMGVAMHGTESDAGDNLDTSSDTSGGAASYRRVHIMRGPTVRDAAILWRTAAPGDTDPDTNAFILQGWIPRGVFTQVGSFKYYKEQIALPLTFEALESTNSSLTALQRLGWIDVQGETP